MYYRFLLHHAFGFDFSTFCAKTILRTPKDLEQIIVGSQLALAAFSGLNAFIYKLALE